MNRILLIVAMCLLVTGLSAATLEFSASGVWDSTTPSSEFTAPDTPWSLSFFTSRIPSDVPDWPKYVRNIGDEFAFDIPITGFRYMLGGALVIANPVAVRVSGPSLTDGPTLLIFFERIPIPASPPFTDADATPVQGFAFGTAETLSGGGLTQPLFLKTGTFTEFSCILCNAYYESGLIAGRSEDTVIKAELIPEPSSFLLLFSGGAFVLWRMRRA